MKANKIYLARLNSKKDDFFVNSHTHIFNANDAPKYLAKKFVIWPFYYLINTQWAIAILKWYRKRESKKFRYRSKNKIWQNYLSSKSPIYQLVRKTFLLIINVAFLFYSLYLLQPVLRFWPIRNLLQTIFESAFSKKFLFFSTKIYYVLLIIVLFLLFKKLRNWMGKLIWSNIKKRLGKEWVEFMLRYRNILFFAGYGNMMGIFNKLKMQYPPKTRFVALPMDMEYMEAGSVGRTYMVQMKELLKIKNKYPRTIYPFLFAHPERMNKSFGTKLYFSGHLVNGKYKLNDCHIKDYFKGGCSGVKIYPALGYYPFDKALLPLWLYCAQNNIPITTHCSVGPIFYRGNLKRLPIQKIDRHPVFKEIVGKNSNGTQKIENLRLPLHKNHIFQRNFTHPLNYTCLLHEPFLKKVLDYYKDPKLDILFGYDIENKEKPLERNLAGLKVNLAHYGGSENWDEFLAKDRYSEANVIVNKPNIGLDLTNRLENKTILYNMWHYIDWFSLITSMIWNFENVYTDISYTTHNLKYLNLLSEIMDNPYASNKILFGTDFYVVSNHKSEKQYWIDMQNTLGAVKWNKLARSNPKTFLSIRNLNR